MARWLNFRHGIFALQQGSDGPSPTSCYFAWGCFRYFDEERAPVDAFAQAAPDAIVPLTGCFRANLNRVEPWITIHLESAVFMFHINGTTQGITGSLRAACSEPVQRFLACPFS
jgi:hypothetical protein